MRSRAATLFVVAGAVLAAVSTADAQSKTPAYVIVEVQTTDDAAYQRNFAPLVRPVIEGQGGQYLVRSGKSETIDGAGPSKMAVIEFEDLQHATAAFRSPAYRDLRKVVDKYATFRIIAIEGLPTP